MAFAHARAGHDPYYAAAFPKFTIALPSLTLATNVAATSLVLSRVVYFFSCLFSQLAFVV
jgi:hypothetical protein